MTLRTPFSTAAAAACALLLAPSAGALAATGERTPVNFAPTPTTTHAVGAGGGGSLVQTFVGLAIVIAVIYGLYWVLKQVKSGREAKSSGRGLSPLASLPLGANRSLHMVRAGSDVVLLGVSEHGVTPIKTYREDEAEAIGLLDPDAEEDMGAAEPNGDGSGIATLVDSLRRITVRR